MGSPVKHVRSGTRVSIGATTARKFRSPLDKAKGYEVVWKQVSGLFEAARPYVADANFVYVVGEADDGPVKIGVSKDPIGRLRSMQTGNPRRLRIEYVLMGNTAIEKLLHEMWEPYAIVSSRNAGKPDAAPGTEWFTADVRDTLLPIVHTAVAAQIERLQTPEPPPGFADMEQIVRDAHQAHDFVPHVRHQVLMLGQGAGYALRSRRSRI